MKLPDLSHSETPDHPSVTHQAAVPPKLLAPRRKLLIVVLIFLTALGVRLLNWQGHHNEALAVQTAVALNYKHQARLLRANGVASLCDPSAATNNPDLLGHPPGYPILLSFVYRIAGESDAATQLLQTILDSLSAVLLVLIACELFPAAVGVIVGLMAAFAPQFSWNSLTLLPDSLAALPILLAVLIITKTVGQAFLPVQPGAVQFKRNRQEYLSYPDNRSRLLSLFAAGALIGVSIWLRANALLLAPFVALSFCLIFKRGARLRPALILIGGFLLVIIPLTVRNLIVFDRFIPISLGAGQTLIEGIADYNMDGSLGLPQTDMELIRGEAETANRPEYASSLFTPDGVERDRARLARGFAVIRAHPIWFAGVMVQRAASMLRLERTPLRLASANSGASHLFQWPLRIVQQFFITALFLPLTLIGGGILFYRRRLQTLAILLVVPCYYFCTQSALHTEYRYVLVIHYFLFVLAAVAIHTITGMVRSRRVRET